MDNGDPFETPGQLFDIEELRARGIESNYCTFHYAKRYE